MMTASEPTHDRSRARTFEEVHAQARARGEDFYLDPQTGYRVWTADYLERRGECCGSGCRHCPYESKAK